MRTPLSKPDYQFIQSHSCKEFVMAVRRLIQHERLYHLRDVHHVNRPEVLDVVLRGGRKVWIIRHFKGSTKAVMQGFPVTMFEMLTDSEKPDIDEFLRAIGENVVGSVDETLWFPKIM